jgi:hypothetical protein
MLSHVSIGQSSAGYGKERKEKAHAEYDALGRTLIKSHPIEITIKTIRI